MTNLFFHFDLDGTLTREELLPRIAREFGASREIETLTSKTIAGEIDFEESFIRRVSLLGHIPPDEVANVILEAPVNERLVQWVRDHSAVSTVVTGNLNLWVQPWLDANGLTGATSEGVFRDGRVVLTKILAKGTIVAASKLEGQVVFVGDGANDAEAFELADYAIAFAGVHRPAEILLELADCLAMEESGLCRILSQLSYQQQV